MSTLLVDNYDSYTYNVFHMLAAASGEEPIVIRNDVVSWRALARWDFDAIVISPGPGRPERWHDFGVCSDILRSAEIPVLGVCLGHQGLGQLLNGVVRSAPMVMHGRLSGIRHDGSGLFDGIPQGFSVVRYHSLAVVGELGAQGRVTAWTDEGVVMALEHRTRPMWGVQFHPESIATEHGRRLFENFYVLAKHHNAARARRTARPPTPPPRPARPPTPSRKGDSGRERPRLHVRSLEGEPSTELLFERLFGDAEHAFWLDSVDAPTPMAKRSFLGATLGEHGCVIEYEVDEQLARIHTGGATAIEHGSIFALLDRELATRRVDLPRDVPTGLVGGFVGYLGYECKADCGSPSVHRSDIPDAVLMLANRIVAVDHVAHRTHLLALDEGDDREADTWLAAAEEAARQLLMPAGANKPPLWRAPHRERQEPAAVSFRCGRGREQYLADIARCQAALSAGESYEVCLTDQIHTDAAPEPFDLYRLLRRRNPAPFAAYLKLGEVTVLSSSPERFLSVDRARRVQARPIKGTAPRSTDPVRDAELREELRSDEKTFAEHLMIVDLLRNDLGRVCKVDSVRVPQFMVVEPYTTVHQMISTITGVLDRARTPLECVRACFPGGSMTGAPKLRTMSIIDDIEREARGVYSGAIGYFGLDGSVDLSIVIRTIVMRPGATTIGAGGAIVMQSDPEEEFDEILLKARAPMSAIAQAVTGEDTADTWTIQLQPDAAAAGSRVTAAGAPVESTAAPASIAPGAARPSIEGDRERPPSPADTGLLIRGAQAEDVERIAAAVVDLLVELGAAPPAASAMQDTVQALLGDREAGAVLVAEADGALVGVLAASWQTAIHMAGRYALIQDLWVQPAWRSRSIGHKLLDELFVLARRHGIACVEVGLPRDRFANLRATQAFYTASGFAPLGTRMRRALA